MELLVEDHDVEQRVAEPAETSTEVDLRLRIALVRVVSVGLKRVP
jgi:hypothetical protein